MRREILWLLLLSVAMATFSTAPSEAQETGGQFDWVPCGPPPRFEQPQPSSPPGNYPPDADCPCFSPGRLAQLPHRQPELCIDSGLVIQISGWFGEPTTDGRVGFNVLATETSSRTVGGACLYHRRVQSGPSVDQEYSRRVDLPPALASLCYELLESWLAARGGCADEQAAGQLP